ncbi:MAG: 4-hydroxybenzoate octaprenyltransferase [Pseudomonadota bacterium]|nr:4-hydroxybenzoate octaprenyltransferase [Pseudomonadota bacterium]
MKLKVINYGILMRLNRPIGIWLLMWPTLWSLWIAGKGSPDPKIFSIFMIGIVVMRSAGCVINDYADREFDGQVERTQDRPLVTGEVTINEAIILFTLLITIAISLALLLNPSTQLLALFAGLITILYPYCKRFFVAPQLILGVAFGFSVPMSFSAQIESIPNIAWLIFLAVIIYAIIYDTIYAMIDREYDLKIGIKSTAILFGKADIFIISIMQFFLILLLVILGEFEKLGLWYKLSLFAVALLMGYQNFLIRPRTAEKCMRAFVNNHLIGLAIFSGIFLDFTFRVDVY